MDAFGFDPMYSVVFIIGIGIGAVLYRVVSDIFIRHKNKKKSKSKEGDNDSKK